MTADTNESPESTNPIDDVNSPTTREQMPVADDIPSDKDFEIEVAQRVKRLPPYMFGRINNLLYQKRRSGEDVIDMGMGK